MLTAESGSTWAALSSVASRWLSFAFIEVVKRHSIFQSIHYEKLTLVKLTLATVALTFVRTLSCAYPQWPSWPLAPCKKCNWSELRISFTILLGIVCNFMILFMSTWAFLSSLSSISILALDALGELLISGSVFPLASTRLVPFCKTNDYC